MKAILMGLKEEWEPAISLLSSFRQDVIIVGLSDPFDHELAKENEAVFTLKEAMEVYKNGEVDGIIITDGSQWTWSRYLYENGVERTFMIPTKYYHKDSKPDSNAEDLVRAYRDKKPELHNLEFQLADHCNLRCKACAHFSNLVKEPVFADKNQFRKDLHRLADLFDNIKEFYLMGGEPLLNPEVGAYCRMVRSVFPYTRLILVTNGILIPAMKEDTIKDMLETDTEVSVSNYECIDENKIKRFLEEHNFQKIEFRNGKEMFTKNLSTIPDDDTAEVFRRCTRHLCNFLDRGQVAACTQPFTVRYFNEYFDEHFSTKGGISLYEEDMTGFQLLERLWQPMDACRNCTYEKTVQWGISRDPVSKEDWCVK